MLEFTTINYANELIQEGLRDTEILLVLWQTNENFDK
jgi:hypothetical protein